MPVTSAPSHLRPVISAPPQLRPDISLAMFEQGPGTGDRGPGTGDPHLTPTAGADPGFRKGGGGGVRTGI